MFVNQKEKDCIFYWNIKDNKAKISYIEVSPRNRKKGIASSVVKDFIKYCTINRIKHIEIDAYKKAINFWRKLSFNVDVQPQVIDGIKQDYYNGNFVIPL